MKNSDVQYAVIFMKAKQHQQPVHSAKHLLQNLKKSRKMAK